MGNGTEIEAKELSPEARAILRNEAQAIPYALPRSYRAEREDIVDRLRQYPAIADAYPAVKEAADEIERLRKCLDIARTALLNIERRSEEARAALSKALGSGG